MVSAMSRDFDEIHTIELFRPLYEKACVRFAVLKNIHLYFGDSSKELANILENLDHPALFWLDAHYSGQGTARGHDDSPILCEINKVFEYGSINHVILIDDASLFNGSSGYPEINAFRKYVLEKRQNYNFTVSNDIIVLAPKECS
jgi:predicted nicotinamide N-methyase